MASTREKELLSELGLLAMLSMRWANQRQRRAIRGVVDAVRSSAPLQKS